MVYKRNSLTKLYLLAPIIPIVFFISTGITFFSTLQINSISEEEQIQAPRFILSTLKGIVSQEDHSGDMHKGILFVATQDGQVYVNNLGFDLVGPFRDFEGAGKSFFQDQDSPGILIIKFKYQGQNGVCFFNLAYLPVYLRSSVKDVFFSLVFLISGGMVILGYKTLRSLKKTTEALVSASDMIARGDFTIPPIPLPHNEMDPVVTSFQNMSRQLQTKDAMEKRFMMAITHDLKTPLTSIRGYLEAFRDGMISDPEEIKKTAEMMLNKAATLEDRIQEAIEFSRDGVSRPVEVTLNVTPFLETLLATFKEDGLARNRLFDYTLHLDSQIVLQGQEKTYERVLENLFDNACRYTREGDKILFTAYQEEDQVIMKMEDSGIGVKPENREKVFQLFFREDQSRNSRGMGIGLSKVRTVVEGLGGSVYCFPSELGGAGFALRIPVRGLP